MSTAMHDQILHTCKTILEENQAPDHTMPAPRLYPHQWLWDSCFIAIGLRHYDITRAQQEIGRIFESQWTNGMIPHMIFESDKRFKQDRDVWRSHVSPYSPDNLATSGITQPPVLAEAVSRIGSVLPPQKAITFYKQCLPSMYGYHTWLMTERDPHSEGLALQIHPWETGLDNTPPWMNQLHEHSKPWWIALVEQLRMDGLVSMLRRDTRHVPPGQRITNTEALIVFDMIRRFRRKNYDISKILHRSMFCIEDIGFNSILARNNQIIIKLSEVARMKPPHDFVDLVNRHSSSLNKCWDEQSKSFYSRDFITHDLIKEDTISSLLPLYSGMITKEQAHHLVLKIRNYKEYGLNYPLPSVPLNNPQFNPLRYWQGPTWLNTNWLVIDGLNRYGYKEDAEKLRQASLDLVHKHGPYEYFSPNDGQPLGASEFSWTAALAIDLIHQST